MSVSDHNPASESLNVLTATGTLNPTLALTELHLTDGRILRLPTSLLQNISAPSLAAEPGELVIPIVEERLDISKRTVETAKIRLQKVVQEFDAVVDEPLAVRTYDIEHVLLNTPIETAPAVRTEGDTVVYPLIEERLILTKQLILKEEVRVTHRDTERRDQQTVALRREHLIVEREAAK